MWKRIGIVIGGAVFILAGWFCIIFIIFISIARFFETTELVRYITPVVILGMLFLSCWFVGLWVGRKIGEKGWLYGGLPALICAVAIFLRPRVWKIGYLKGDLIFSSIIGFSILPAILILLGVAGGIRGERVAKRRKTRI